MGNKQIQKAGDGSQQLQADKMIVNMIGIDEKRAREVFQEMSLQLRKEYTEDALSIANSRVAKFQNQLLPKMEAIDGALEAFADPSFQLLLVEAQKTAASTERTADYDLLSELLIYRFQKGENRITRAGISRAVEIVDEISDDALLGLTVLHAVSSFHPINGRIHYGLDILNDMFGKIIYGILPVGNDWLDHLDLLNTIRIDYSGRLKKTNEFYPEALSGYVDVGIEKNSENYDKAMGLLKSAGLPQYMLIDHELNTNFARISCSNRNRINALTIQTLIFENGLSKMTREHLTSTQLGVLKSIYGLYTHDDSIKEENIKVFMEEWNKFPNLKILREWWDNIPNFLQITSVGRVLAHSNAQRCDKSLPSLY